MVALGALTQLAPGTAAQPSGAGSTFAFPIYAKWFEAYHKLHPAGQISYQPVGSGLGIRYAIEGKADFGASDAPMTDEQLAEFREKRGTDVLHFPTVLGADVPSYNIPGLNAELDFTPEALAGIFLGKITQWNDQELVRANPHANLPPSRIVVIHRSDGSGTTYVWTDYLSKVSPEWRAKIGTATAVNWPVGLGAQGNSGVSDLIEETAYAIGYVELIYAVQHHLPYGRVRNASGVFMKAALPSIAAAAAGVKLPEDFRISISNSPSKAAYPIASFSWLLIPARIGDPAKKAVVIGFLRWMLTGGQSMTEALSYPRLPQDVIAKELKAVSQIQ